jgi:hypothetical protein
MSKFGEWQPIETVPKDCTAVLVFVLGEPDKWEPTNNTNYMTICFYNEDGEAYSQEWGWNEKFMEGRITHWTPLPIPPFPHSMDADSV